jgi:hypothetical protein
VSLLDKIEAWLTDPAIRRRDRYSPDDERVLTYIHGKLSAAVPEDDTSGFVQVAKMRLRAYDV